MIKSVLRSLGLMVLAFGFLMLMQKFGFLRVSEIVKAFTAHPKTIVGICALQIATAAVMMLRYWRLLNLFGVETHLKQASSATFVSTALGQWFPGSLAVVEVLRVSLMFGGESNSRPLGGKADVGLKSRLAIVSLVDRLVGFLGILIMGFVFSGYLLAKMALGGGDSLGGVVFLFALAACGVLALVGLPFIVRLKIIRHLTHRRFSLGGANESPSQNTISKIFRHLEAIRHDIEAGTRHPVRLIGPVMMSMVSLLLTSTTLFLSARALAVSLDLFQIICVFPIISVAALLPLGFAGIGGYQLVMASVFSIFAVSPSVVASAGVLQSALQLLANTLLGLLFFKVCFTQIRSAFRRETVVSLG